MKKKSILLLCLLLLACALLCGCTESEIACGVTADNRAFLRFDLELDLRELNVREQIPILTWIRDRAAELKEKGFEVEHNAVTVGSEPTRLKAELSRRGSSRAEAMELLRQMLTDDTLSPFTAAAAELLPQELQDAFRVELQAEPGQLLATAGIESFPKRLRERLDTWLAEGSLRLTLTLPATELPAGEEAELEDGVARKSVSVPLTGSAELRLETLYYTGAGENRELWWGGEERQAENAAALAASMERDRAGLEDLSRILTAAAAALGGLALLFFVWGTLRARKRRRLAAAAAALRARQTPAFDPQQPCGAYPQQPYGAYPQQPSGAYPQQPYGAYPQQPSGAYPQQPSGAYPQQTCDQTERQ